ncbi:hypothetical protein NDU88_002854 [Pleurodeles waltl]|uniref:Uncharacterized protein n=1 Tax=Pleurodeles waltl TaxID=8319 RepID=A0AAV7UYF8_PLEWA|nr:hypothetical protein NDU88_002854 [Pleurodeles waltl]
MATCRCLGTEGGEVVTVMIPLLWSRESSLPLEPSEGRKFRDSRPLNQSPRRSPGDSDTEHMRPRAFTALSQLPRPTRPLCSRCERTSHGPRMMRLRPSSQALSARSKSRVPGP